MTAGKHFLSFKTRYDFRDGTFEVEAWCSCGDFLGESSFELSDRHADRISQHVERGAA